MKTIAGIPMLSLFRRFGQVKSQRRYKAGYSPVFFLTLLFLSTLYKPTFYTLAIYMSMCGMQNSFYTSMPYFQVLHFCSCSRTRYKPGLTLSLAVNIYTASPRKYLVLSDSNHRSWFEYLK
ncbi:hypothetical protein M430DRAFT_225449 [Amorphotheca resinae ATCC 22711]|jgi:hypothetical protein|uniref:Uncharacterized protein n=1 Tax=Amorphotheca resinae ATCC 22711 TaxID=857342 RepID=A0A2T3B6P5_AMORE|nr:hypothetical protein M430DRAFT_225449 [Amorphotheca resinae ATCC 22711]PSS22424.1 hypothetical protein M430DRAFT_225449 [Amorphotheca resinae ATCC 22711]